MKNNIKIMTVNVSLAIQIFKIVRLWKPIYPSSFKFYEDFLSYVKSKHCALVLRQLDVDDLVLFIYSFAFQKLIIINILVTIFILVLNIYKSKSKTFTYRTE